MASVLHAAKLDELISGFLRTNKYCNIGNDVYRLLFQYCLLFDTQILSKNQMEILLSFLLQQKYWNLADINVNLLHRSSMFKNKISSFDSSHSLIIIHSNENKIYGGFTPFNWKINKSSFGVNCDKYQSLIIDYRTYDYWNGTGEYRRILNEYNQESFLFQIHPTFCNVILNDIVIDGDIKSYEIFQVDGYENYRRKVDQIIYKLLKQIANYVRDHDKWINIINGFTQNIIKLLKQGKYLRYLDVLPMLKESEEEDENDGNEVFNIDSLLFYPAASKLFNILFVNTMNNDKIPRDYGLLYFVMEKLNKYKDVKHIINDVLCDDFREKYKNNIKIYKKTDLMNHKLNKINLIKNDIYFDPESRVKCLENIFEKFIDKTISYSIINLLGLIVEYEMGEFQKVYQFQDNKIIYGVSSRDRIKRRSVLSRDFRKKQEKQIKNYQSIIHIKFPNNYQYILEIMVDFNEKTFILYDEIRRLLNDNKLDFELIVAPNILIKEKNKLLNQMEAKTFKQMMIYPMSNIRLKIIKQSMNNNNYIKSKFIKQYLTENITVLPTKSNTKKHHKFDVNQYDFNKLIYDETEEMKRDKTKRDKIEEFYKKKRMAQLRQKLNKLNKQ